MFSVSGKLQEPLWRVVPLLSGKIVLAQCIVTARDLYSSEPFLADLDETIYALGSTTIDLCLSMFPWATFRKHKAAIKLHTLLDLRGNIPTFIYISEGKVHDVNALDILPLETNAFYVMDRGYLDFARLYTFTQFGAIFVTRAKVNTQFEKLSSHPVDRTTVLICDQTITLSGARSRKDYPDKLHRVKFHDIHK